MKKYVSYLVVVFVALISLSSSDAETFISDQSGVVSSDKGHEIQDEGTPVTPRPKLNFTGAGAACTDNSVTGTTDCDFSGGGGGGLNNIVEDLTPQLGGALDVNGNNITMTSTETVDGRDLSVDGAKLDDVEANATADQTGAEIKISYEGEANTNAFTDAEQTKLTGIATSATANPNALDNVVEDLTPQLGANLDVNTFGLTSTTDQTFTTGSGSGNDFTINTTMLVVEGDTGRVGVGTVTPSSMLEVLGTGPSRVIIGSSNNTTGIVFSSNIGSSVLETNTSDTIDNASISIGGGGDGTSTTRGAVISVQGEQAGGNVIISAADTAGFIQLMNANVGIGTTTPAELIEIEDGTTATTLQISNTATDGDPTLSFALSGVKTFTMGVDDGDSDKFKIGTTDLATGNAFSIDTFSTVSISDGTVAVSPPADLTFHANYNTDIDGSVGDGTLTGTGTGLPTVSGGELLLNSDDTRYVTYGADLNADSQQVGAVRLVWTPNYTGSPSTDQSLFVISQAAGNTNNQILVEHLSTGNILVQIKSSTGTNITNAQIGSFSATSGTEVEFEYNYDYTGGSSRLFIDGTQFGPTMGGSGTRSASITLLRVGTDATASNTSNFKVNNITIFNTVQNTTTYVPSGVEYNGTRMGLAFMGDVGTGLVRNTSSLDVYHNSISTLSLNNGSVGLGMTDPDEQLEITGRFHLGQITAPGVTTDKLYNIGGDLIWNAINVSSLVSGSLQNIVEDLTPQLGANLDVNNFGLTSGGNLPITVGTGVGDKFTLNTSGFVYEGDTGDFGIGANPSSRLHIVDNNNGSAIAQITNNDVGAAADATLRVSNSTSTFDITQYGAFFTSTGSKIADGSRIFHTSALFGADLTIGSSAGIRFYAGGENERLRLESDGDLVLGTTTAGADLHIYANNTITTGNLGFRIEQDGTGDVLQNFLLTGGQDYSIGIDNDSGDAFVIGVGSDLGTTPVINVDTSGVVTFPQGYTRKLIIAAGAASQGSTAPTFTTVGTTRGLAFNANAEQAFFALAVPPDWDGTSNFSLGVHWLPTSGDAIANAETVKFDISYHASALGEAVDQGTVAAASTTYTQSGAGVDKEHLLTMITIPATGGNQPLAVGDTLNMVFNRDATTDTYSGNPNIYFWTLEYTAMGLPQN